MAKNASITLCEHFDEAFGFLSENPDVVKTCDEIRKGYRKFPLGSHMILDKYTGNQQILVFRALHKRMDANAVHMLTPTWASCQFSNVTTSNC